jgi:membrane protein implicated in regulation of membrane protease activity
MSTAIVYAAYLTVSIGLTVVVASALSRSGQVVLEHLFGGDDGMAAAVNRMLVVGFYLLSLGYVALTTRTPGHIDGAGQAISVLSVKVGEELLVFGALYLVNIAVFARFRRRRETSADQTASREAGRQRSAQTDGPAPAGRDTARSLVG